MKAPEIVLVTVADGSVALFVNGSVIAEVDPEELGADPAQLGDALTKAIGGIQMASYSIDTPKDADWNWSDVFECLAPRTEYPDFVEVAHWEKYSEPVEHPIEKPFKIGIIDQRETGQLFIDIEGDTSSLDDQLSATFEVNNIPGKETQVQTMHLHFDGDNLAATFFKVRDTYLIRLESEVALRSVVLPNGQAGFLLE